MTILSQTKLLRQILKNTESIKEHLGIHDDQLDEDYGRLNAHDDRLDEIETKLRDLSIPRGRRAYVLSADARQVAEEMDLTVTGLYRILRHAGLVIPDTDHTTQKQRVGGELCRVLVFREVL